VKLLDQVAVETGTNTRVPHLEEDTIFGSAKRKLDLPLGDASDSHRHDRINFTIPKIGKGLSPADSKRVSASSTHSILSSTPGKSSSTLYESQHLKKSTTPIWKGTDISVVTKRGLPISESTYSNPMNWQIERIPHDSLEQCQGHHESKKCTTKIARYRCAIAALTFTGIE